MDKNEQEYLTGDMQAAYHEAGETFDKMFPDGVDAELERREQQKQHDKDLEMITRAAKPFGPGAVNAAIKDFEKSHKGESKTARPPEPETPEEWEYELWHHAGGKKGPDIDPNGEAEIKQQAQDFMTDDDPAKPGLFDGCDSGICEF